MGTPDFAVASLRRLVEDGHEVVGVFTQPDKPKNRGMKLTFSPVKEYALTQDLPVYQPLKMRDGEALGILRELAPELIVVAAYGKILPQEILDLPQYGCINVHSSLLPKYRGAAPINWAILNGERITGVSIMYMVAALDAGDVIRTVSTEIGEHEDAAALTLRLSELGAQALSETIPTLADGTAKRTPQDESAFTYAPMLDRSLSPIDWTRSAREIDCQVRGLIPWPCAATSVDGKSVKVYETVSGEMTADAPGTMHAVKRGLSVACGDGKARNNTIFLSDSVYDAATVAAVGVAAHEAGHAVQYAVGYGPVKLRSAIVKTTQFSSQASFVILMLGLVLYSQPILLLGIVLFGVVAFFQLVTLPVEFNASHRALETLEGEHILEDEEMAGARKVLRAAALTYVAALLSSLLQLLRYVLIFLNRSGNRRGGRQ